MGERGSRPQGPSFPPRPAYGKLEERGLASRQLGGVPLAFSFGSGIKKIKQNTNQLNRSL